MSYQVFIIASHGDEQQAERLNRFCQQHTVLSIEKVFVNDGPNSHWSFCVNYNISESNNTPMRLSKRDDTDYKETLNDADFAVFDQLRRARKIIAEEAGVKVYQVASNAQLAAMATGRVQSRAGLLNIEGFGQGKLDSYGDALLVALRKALALDAGA